MKTPTNKANKSWLWTEMQENYYVRSVPLSANVLTSQVAWYQWIIRHNWKVMRDRKAARPLWHSLLNDFLLKKKKKHCYQISWLHDTLIHFSASLDLSCLGHSTYFQTTCDSENNWTLTPEYLRLPIKEIDLLLLIRTKEDVNRN